MAGVYKEDKEKALQYLRKAVNIHDHNEASAWYVGVVILCFQKDYDEAVKWASNAEKLGERNAKTFLGTIYSYLAGAYRDAAIRTIKINEFTQLNAVAAQAAMKCQDQYLKVMFRAYVYFCLLVFGLALVTVGTLFKETLFLSLGVAFLTVGLAIGLLTSLNVEGSMRITYMIRLFLYGMALFLRIASIIIIIGIPFISVFNSMAAGYKEFIVADCYGKDTGRKVVVNEDNMKTADGTKYDRFDPY